MTEQEYEDELYGLRCAIGALRTENAELQAENAHLWESVQNAEHEESVAWDRVRSAERRNDKLRELVGRLYGSYYIEYPDAAEREFAGELRELGVEV